METFLQALQISAIGMVLVFMSLIIVALLIWGLDRLFRPSGQEAKPTAPQPRPSAAIVETSGGDPVTATSSARLGRSVAREAEAAALAVAIVRARNAERPTGAQAAPVAVRRAPMPWERPIPVGAEIPEAETVTVMTVHPGPTNWKSQGRLKAME